MADVASLPSIPGLPSLAGLAGEAASRLTIARLQAVTTVEVNVAEAQGAAAFAAYIARNAGLSARVGAALGEAEARSERDLGLAVLATKGVLGVVAAAELREGEFGVASRLGARRRRLQASAARRGRARLRTRMGDEAGGLPDDVGRLAELFDEKAQSLEDGADRIGATTQGFVGSLAARARSLLDAERQTRTRHREAAQGTGLALGRGLLGGAAWAGVELVDLHRWKHGEVQAALAWSDPQRAQAGSDAARKRARERVVALNGGVAKRLLADVGVVTAATTLSERIVQEGRTLYATAKAEAESAAPALEAWNEAYGNEREAIRANLDAMDARIALQWIKVGGALADPAFAGASEIVDGLRPKDERDEPPARDAKGEPVDIGKAATEPQLALPSPPGGGTPPRSVVPREVEEPKAEAPTSVLGGAAAPKEDAKRARAVSPPTKALEPKGVAKPSKPPAGPATPSAPAPTLAPAPSPVAPKATSLPPLPVFGSPPPTAEAPKTGAVAPVPVPAPNVSSVPPSSAPRPASGPTKSAVSPTPPASPTLPSLTGLVALTNPAPEPATAKPAAVSDAGESASTVTAPPAPPPPPTIPAAVGALAALPAAPAVPPPPPSRTAPARTKEVKAAAPGRVRVQRDAGERPDVDPLALRTGLLRAGGPGTPVSATMREGLAPHLGFDPARARLHTGPTAAEAADRLHARAFTIGRDVFFGAGQYDPASRTGLGLVAHELTHVGQQTGGAPEARFDTPNGGDEMEAQAQRTAALVLAHGTNLAGLQVRRFEREYVPAGDEPLTAAQHARLDAIGAKALKRAAEQTRAAGLPFELNLTALTVEVALDLEEMTDAEAAEAWAEALVAALSAVSPRQAAGVERAVAVQRDGLVLPGVPMSVEPSPENLALVLRSFRPSKIASNIFDGEFSGHPFILRTKDKDALVAMAQKGIGEGVEFMHRRFDSDEGRFLMETKNEADHWLASGFARLFKFGAPSQIEVEDFGGKVYRSILEVESSLKRGDVAEAVDRYKRAAEDVAQYSHMVYEYCEGAIEGAERLLVLLEVIKYTSGIVLAVLGAVAAAPPAAAAGVAAFAEATGITVGAGSATAAPIVMGVSGAATPAALAAYRKAEGEEVDWTKTTIDVFVAGIFALVAGPFMKKVQAPLLWLVENVVGKAALDYAYKKLGESFIKEMILNFFQYEATIVINGFISGMYEKSKGSKRTWGQIAEGVLPQMYDPKELLMQLLLSKVVAKVKTTYVEPYLPPSATTPGKTGTGDEDAAGPDGQPKAKPRTPAEEEAARKVQEEDRKRADEATKAAKAAVTPEQMRALFEKGGPEAKALAQELIRSTGDWKGRLKSMSGKAGELGLPAQAYMDAARGEILSGIESGLKADYPELEASNVGSPGFASDKDITMKPTAEARERISTPEEVAKYVEMSDRAVAEYNAKLRAALGGHESDAAIDTNVYSWTGADVPLAVPKGQLAAFEGAKDAMSLVEIRRGIDAGAPNPQAAEAQWRQYKAGQLERFGTGKARGEQGRIEAEARAATERNQQAADAKYAEIVAAEGAAADQIKRENPGLSEAAVNTRAKEAAAASARERLAAELRKPQPDMAKVAELQSRVKLSEPGAFASQDAIDDVVNDQQRQARPGADPTVVPKTAPVTEAAALVRAAGSYYGQLREHLHGSTMDRLKAVSKYVPRIENAVDRANHARAKEPSAFTRRNMDENAQAWGKGRRDQAAKLNPDDPWAQAAAAADPAPPDPKDAAMRDDVSRFAGEDLSTHGPLSPEEVARRDARFEEQADAYVRSMVERATGALQRAERNLRVKVAADPIPVPPPEPAPATNASVPGPNASHDPDAQPPTVRAPKPADDSGPPTARESRQGPASAADANEARAVRDIRALKAIPEGTIQREIGSLAEAQALCAELIQRQKAERSSARDQGNEQPSERELLIMHNVETGEHVIVQGADYGVRARLVDEHGMLVSKERMEWRTDEHYHPGTGFESRIPTPDDFDGMRERIAYRRDNGVPDRPEREQIRWIDENTGATKFTEFGYDPSNPEGSFYVVFENSRGARVEQRFRELPVTFNPIKMVEGGQ